MTSMMQKGIAMLARSRRWVKWGTGIGSAGLAVVMGLAVAATPRAAGASMAGAAAVRTHLPSHAVSRSAAQSTIELWLAPRTSAATAFAAAVSTPRSPAYHQYLTPNAYTTRFGPTSAEVTRVTAWLQTRSLTGITVSSERDYMSVTGPTTLLDRAFGETTPGTAVSVPRALIDDVVSVTGPAGAATSSTASAMPPSAPPRACSRYWGQRSGTVHPSYDGAVRLPRVLCGYSAAQLRTAYGLTAGDTGAGVTVAMIETGTPVAMLQTLRDYARRNHLPRPSSSQLREENLGHGRSCGNPGFGEEQEDSEAIDAMAPAADQLMVDGDSCTLGQQGMMESIAIVLAGNGARPQASIVSNSWGGNGPSENAQLAAPMHALDLRAAAEGVGMYFSSGDTPGLHEPAVDPYATAVGGTTLEIGARGQRVFETGWSDERLSLNSRHRWAVDPLYPSPLNFREADGGGVTSRWAQPSYQVGVVPRSMSRLGNGTRGRAFPDISADGDPFTGMLVGTIQSGATGRPGPYETGRAAGTSLACPLVAAIVADAQQHQATAFGFLNPLLYSLAGTRALRDVLPVTSATPLGDTMGLLKAGTAVINEQKGEYRYGPVIQRIGVRYPRITPQITARGYDTETGLGTPNGNAFIQALRSGR